jgi:hypothetical protein
LFVERENLEYSNVVSAEAYVDGAWRAFDATGLAPRSSLLRIVTGKDASDAFLDNHGGEIYVDNMWVRATVDGYLPRDNGVDQVSGDPARAGAGHPRRAVTDPEIP